MKAHSKRSGGTGFSGFDGVRFVAAWGVVLSHCYPIALGERASDPLATLLGVGNSLGDYAVRIFFIMSGFLLTRSLDQNADPLRFLVNRLLRIVPGFCFAILVMFLVIAPFLSPVGFWENLCSSKAWTSIVNSVGYMNDYGELPLAASRHRELAGYMNGALWTISYEMVYYLFLLSLFMLLRRDSWVAVAGLALALVSVVGTKMGWVTVNWRDDPMGAVQIPMAMLDKTLPYFFGGVVYYAWQKRWGLSGAAVKVALGVTIGALAFSLQHVVFAFSGPFLLAYLGQRPGPVSRMVEKMGDLSYGIYLFGWPISLVFALESDVPLLVFLKSFPIVFGLAWLMSRLVERPANDWLKPLVLRLVPAFPSWLLGGSGVKLSSRGGRAVEAVAVTAGVGGGPRWVRLVQGGAYLMMFVVVTRFLFYPWPGSANWFSLQAVQLSLVCVVASVLLKIAGYRPPSVAAATPVESVVRPDGAGVQVR